MRIMLLSAAAAVALAACGNSAKTEAPTANAAAAVFPNLAAASYRAEAVATAEDGAQTQIVQIRSGPKTRLEFTSDQGAIIMLMDGETAHALMPAQRMAIRVATNQDAIAMRAPDQMWDAESDGATLTSTGPCTGAGETGVEWTAVKAGEPPSAACVTGDGIILRVREGERVTWETTSVARGPQDPQLFVVPAGYALQDFTAMSRAAQGAAPGPGAPGALPGGMSREEAMRMAEEMAEKAKRAQ
ncbi:MAG: hypothetical protein GC206_08415 [Alphaproteobacteria bacterium]|nr:hypothetical protein [Alphaproteobacteria bacterium]